MLVGGGDGLGSWGCSSVPILALGLLGEGSSGSEGDVSRGPQVFSTALPAGGLLQEG